MRDKTWEEAYRDAKRLLQRGGLWPTPKGEEWAADPDFVEALRSEAYEAIDELAGPELLGIYLLARGLAGPYRDNRDQGPTSEDLGPFADLIEGWE